MTQKYSAISFTGVAARYNQINALPADAATAIGAALKALVPPAQPVLDMGCGAGRIALPAARAGVAIVGIDRDAAMLAEAAAGANGIPFTAVHGDLVDMPLRDNRFGAVLSINVLHLVPAWEQVLQHAVRVMAPGGVLIQGRDWLEPNSVVGRLRQQLRRVVMAREPGLRPTAAANPMVMAQALDAMGGVTEPPQLVARWETEHSPRDVLTQMAQRAFNETWMLSDGLLEASLADLEAWSADTWHDLDAVEPVARGFQLTVTRGLAG